MVWIAAPRAAASYCFSSRPPASRNSHLRHGGGGGFPSPTPPSLPLRAHQPSSAQSRSHHLMRPLGRLSSTAYTATIVPSRHSRLHTPSRMPSPSSAKYCPRYATRAPVAASPIRPDYLRLAQYLRQPLQSPTPPSSRTPFDRHYRTWRDGGAASGQRVCHAAQLELASAASGIRKTHWSAGVRFSLLSTRTPRRAHRPLPIPPAAC
ncbi:hypothetical protein B0H16DRAFT_823621 [Mycena metata]|uniref:Uncharacterized protein n=1 Tax=Mycena metata TaxID=1033252 RepID=A0AAD7IZG1_9AGAR|nr:hypothetical protein B0H16DRAFT_823621 [Mycena metata]